MSHRDPPRGSASASGTQHLIHCAKRLLCGIDLTSVVEVFYRHFKQTFGRRKLRSHAASHAECEAHWSWNQR